MNQNTRDTLHYLLEDLHQLVHTATDTASMAKAQTLAEKALAIMTEDPVKAPSPIPTAVELEPVYCAGDFCQTCPAESANMWSTYLRFPNGEVTCIKNYPLDARELARAEARTMATTLGVTLVDATGPPAR